MKKHIAIIICLVTCFCMMLVPIFATDVSNRDVSAEEVMASNLKELGLFKGVSDTNFDLKRAPTRLEALVMLIRVLGKEQEAVTGTWRHPFTDVPAWANAYVGYAYVNSLTNGVSSTKFGSGDAAASTYLTFMLRALGYSDANNADFAWNNPYDLAKQIGILTDYVDLETFWRADTVTISYAALSVKLKGSEQTLAEKLISAGAFTTEDYIVHYDVLALENGSTTSNLPVASGNKLSAQQISKKCSPAVFYIDIYSYNGELAGSGSGFFISADGLAITNFHVASNSSYFIITTADGKKHDDVTVIDAYKEQDLALLRVVNDESFPYLEIGDSSQLAQGQTVYAIGSPRGLDNTMSQGIISNVNRVLDGTEYVQISVPIAPGSSGGALINEYGQVVGVTSAGYANSTGDLNLAVPIKFAKQLDLSATERLDIWSDDFYPGFSQVYDFGSFTGVQLLSAESTPLGYVCRYDARDFHDMLDVIDPGAPWRDAGSCYAFSLVYYYMAFDQLGFTKEEINDDCIIFSSNTENVIIVTDLDKMVITVVAELVPQYYAEASAVPDVGWYMGFADNDMEPTEEGGVDYFYKWNDYYSANDFVTLIEDYFAWLDDEGFVCVHEDEGTYDDGTGYYSYLYEGKGFSVYYSITEKYLYVNALPIGNITTEPANISYTLSNQSISVNVGETVYVALNVSTSGIPDSADYGFYVDTGTENIAIADWADYDDNSFPWDIKIIGVAPGTTYLKVYNDYNNQYISIPITVLPRVSNPVQYLKNYLVENGIYERMVLDDIRLNNYYIERKASTGEKYTILYCSDTGVLYIKQEYNNGYADVSAILYFDGNGTNEDAAKAFFTYQTTTGEYKHIMGAAFVFRDTILKSNKNFEFYSYTGDDEDMKSLQELLFCSLVVDNIRVADSMFQELGLPISMVDFGYSY